MKLKNRRSFLKNTAITGALAGMAPFGSELQAAVEKTSLSGLPPSDLEDH